MLFEKCTIAVGADGCSKPRSLRNLLFVFAISLMWLLAFSATTLKAQGDPLQAIGIQPLSGQLPVPNGSVNISNGNLHLEFPVVSLPQRGARPLEITIVYDSNLWYQQSSNVWGHRSGAVGTALAGWNMYSNLDGGSWGTVQPHDICHIDGMEAYDTYSNWVYTGPDNVTHSFPTTFSTVVGYLNNCGDNRSMTTPEADTAATDGSGYHLTVINGNQPSTYYNDGSMAGWKDRNGNFTFGYSQDTMGRIPISVSTNGLTSTITVLTAGKNSGTTSYVITDESVNYHTGFGAGGYEASGSFNVIKSIQLPDGTSYSFTYDSGTPSVHYGDLLSMTLPTGSTINFTYANFNDSENAPGGYTHHTTRMLSTMTTPDGQWMITPSVITQCTNTVFTCEQQLQVSKPGYNSRNDITLFKTLVQAYLYPIEADYYNGTVSASNLLATITQSFLYPAQLSRTVTLPSPSGTSINQTTQYCYDTVYGNLLKKWEWTFYTGAIIHDPNPPPTCSVYSGVPAPDRTTTYAYQGGSNYLSSSRNIANLPTSVTVTNSSGGTVAKTLFSYDGATLVTSGATGVKNHDDTNFGSGLAYRGNLTQVQQLVSGTSNYLTKCMTYDITGQLRTATDWNTSCSSANTTAYGYSDAFYTDAGDTNPLSGYTPTTLTNAYLTQITYPTVNSVTLKEYSGYYWGTGQKALSKDANGQSTYFHFYDSLNKPTSTILPPTSAGTGWTYEAYNSTDVQVDIGIGITSSTLSISCSANVGDCRHDQIVNDTMGRITSSKLVSDPDGATITAYTYDSNGRSSTVSNPYRNSSDTTYGLTTTAYDGMDRTIQATQPDGSIQYTSYGAGVTANGNLGLSSQQCSGYGIGYPTLIKDEAGKLRQTWTDGFGRLIEVDEPNPTTGSLSSGSSTCYRYDLNDNLTTVAQGAESRTFTYDMLSRLTSSANPESGMSVTNYYYTTTISGSTPCSGDPSAVCLRVAPQANQTSSSVTTTTTYAYDALNRLTAVSYNDLTPTTPTLKYGYDAVSLTGCTTTPPTLSITNGLGRRTSMCDGSGGTSWSYDAVGDILTEKRTLNSVTNTTQYTYNLDATLASVIYPSGPSGRTISYPPGGAQRPFSAKDTTNNINYGTVAHYSAPGQLASLTNGVSISFTAIYDPRMNLCWQYATTGTTLSWNSTHCGDSATAGNILDMKYAYNAGSSDNGNVATIANNRDSTRSQTFLYDGLNRLSIAGTVNTSGTNCWDEQYLIDRFGNNSASQAASGYNTSCGGERWSLLVNSNNQLQSSSPPYFGYDAAGNLTSIPAPASASYSYDAEGHIRQAVTGSTWNYVYDGDGRRVEKLNSGVVSKLYWNGLDGSTLDETDGAGNLTSEYVFLEGTRIARRDASSNVYYYYADQIGSTRAITNSSGSICFDADFLPFGAEFYEFTSTCQPTNKFTGQERDGAYPTETGLDYFGARQYTSQYFRFGSPDPLGSFVANASNPQSWNQYSYVFNNPISTVDPDGLDPCGDSQVIFGSEECDILSGPVSDSNSHGSGDGSGALPAGQCTGLLCQLLKLVSVLGSGGNVSAAGLGSFQSFQFDASQNQAERQPGRQPDGSYWAPVRPGSEIGKILDLIHPSNPGPIGNGECVVACRQFSKAPPHWMWTAGEKVIIIVNGTEANNPKVAPGTAIATFVNGRYPGNNDPHKNSGIYLGPGLTTNSGGFRILDQWPGSPGPRPRDIIFRGSSPDRSNNANDYYVIIVK